MPGIVPSLIACGALTQIVPPQTRAALGAMLDDRGAAGASRLRFRYPLCRHRDGAFGIRAVHLFPVLTGAGSWLLTIILLPVFTISGPPL